MTESQKPKNNPYFKSGEAAPDAILLDESGQKVNLATYWQTQPTLLIFLRHFG